jgi:hypothetical protein
MDRLWRAFLEKAFTKVSNSCTGSKHTLDLIRATMLGGAAMAVHQI